MFYRDNQEDKKVKKTQWKFNNDEEQDTGYVQ
jgi:hypothetical protein